MVLSVLGVDTPSTLDTSNMGLNGPREYVLPRFAIWLRSGFTVYPDGRAYDDQPQWLLDDFHILLHRYNWHYQRLKPKA